MTKKMMDWGCFLVKPFGENEVASGFWEKKKPRRMSSVYMDLIKRVCLNTILIERIRELVNA